MAVSVSLPSMWNSPSTALMTAPSHTIAVPSLVSHEEGPTGRARPRRQAFGAASFWEVSRQRGRPEDTFSGPASGYAQQPRSGRLLARSLPDVCHMRVDAVGRRHSSKVVVSVLHGERGQAQLARTLEVHRGVLKDHRAR